MSIDDQISQQKTCSERIKENFDGRNDYLEKLFDAINDEKEFDGYEDPRDALFEFPMGVSVDKIIHVKIELSWGGPSDYIEVEIYDNGEIKSAIYHFADWFDHAKMEIPKDSFMYDYVVQTVDSYTDLF